MNWMTRAIADLKAYIASASEDELLDLIDLLESTIADLQNLIAAREGDPDQ